VTPKKLVFVGVLGRNFRFCKSCRRAESDAVFTIGMDSSKDFMGRGGLRFSLSLIVSEL